LYLDSSSEEKIADNQKQSLTFYL